MRSDSLTLRGILAFTEQVTFDFKDLPPGLIAVVGPNGAGKTTFMEAPIAAEYRQFPSRQKELFDYANGTDAFIEHVFELEGRGLYRARLNLDGPHRKAEATLSQILPDGRIVLLNDGKVSTYDPVIAGLLPRFEDLLASVFAAQKGRGAFSSLDTKGKRELFASLLGLDHIEDMALRGRRAADRVTQEIERQSMARDFVARQIGPDADSILEQRAQRLQVDGGTAESRREELRRLIADAERDLSTHQADAAAHAAARERFDRLEAERLATTARRNDTLGAILHLEQTTGHTLAKEVAAHVTWLDRNATEQADESAYRAEIAEAASRCEATKTDATSRIAANEGLLVEAEAIRKACDDLTVLDARIAFHRDAIGKATQTREDHRRREQVQREAMVQVDRAAAALARAEQDASLLDRTPFGGQCSPCQFVAGAVAAQATIAELRERTAAKPSIETNLLAAAEQIETISRSIDDLAVTLRELERERHPIKTQADKQPYLDAVAERMVALRRLIDDADVRHRDDVDAAKRRAVDRIARLLREAEQRRAEHEARLAEVRSESERRTVALTDEAGRLADAITAAMFGRDEAADQAKATKDAARAAERAVSALATYREELERVLARIAGVATERAALEADRAKLLTLRADLDATEGRIETLRAELVDWTVLVKALSRDGVPTLEIDHAGPTVSAYANDLLQACFGGRFSIELVTQAPKATKGKDGSTHKEVFKANIYDQQRAGEVRDLDDLSGGEGVVVEECLRSAIALLVNQRNQQPIRTCWRDETTGALYKETAPLYVTMLRRLQAIGGFHQILFVTHNEDCARLADAQIRVDGGTLAIALPPFVEEEVPA